MLALVLLQSYFAQKRRVKKIQFNFCQLPYTVYIYIKNFAWEDQRRKQYYTVHIAPGGVNSAILFVYRTGYMYGKELEGFQKVFSQLLQ